ncbi:MAG TPA: hypothetical protein VHQ90_19995 [Thermoanaerobaculia bacterium]|nr:hypothetical protein [Thermoanaerobaculia bacterium]
MTEAREPAPGYRGRGGRLAGRALSGFCLLAVAALAVAWAVRPLSHDDLFWHLRTGEWIAGHHAVPLTDLFSYTRFGQRWITHEWGFSLLSYGVFRVGGYAGLLGLTVVLTIAIFAAVGWCAAVLAGKRGPRSHVLLAVLLALGLWAVSSELFLRAALAGELLFALMLLALGRFRQAGGRWPLAALVGLFWVWGNLHSGVVFGLLVLALFAFEAVIGRTRGLGSLCHAGPPAPYLWTLAAALLASLMNPNGIEELLYPFRLGRLLFASWIAWDLGHFSAAAPSGDVAFSLLLVVLLAGLLPIERARRLSLAEVLASATLFFLTFRTHRFVFDFVVVAVPIAYRLWMPPLAPGRDMARSAGSLSPLRPARTWSRGPVAVVTAAGAVALAAAAAGVWAGLPHPMPAISPRFPEAALRFASNHRIAGIAGIGGHVFNHQNFGGYAGWRLRAPIFWDGRNDVFASLVHEVTTTPFAEVAERYAVDYLLITDREYRDLLPELATGRWGLVYWDDYCAIYLRRGRRFAPLLARLELRLFPPFGGRPGLSKLALDPRLAGAARQELDRVLAANPRAQRALYFKGVISLYRGELDRAGRELAAARAIGPNDQVSLALKLLERR